jgi:DNA-binding FadR family transcriptional regulator
MENLTSLKSVTLADGVESCLLEYIQNTKMQPGDLLPKEDDLALRLSVSRHIVREGVSRLKALGIVESRKRKGMTLCRPNAFAGVSKLAETRLFSSEECREFIGIRVVMELGMADFIFERKTPEQLAELRKAAGKPQNTQTMTAELSFHGKLFAIGGNRMADQFRNILTTSFEAIYQDMAQVKKGLKTPSHLEICDTLENGTKTEFYQIMKAHFEPYVNW